MFVHPVTLMAPPAEAAGADFTVTGAGNAAVNGGYNVAGVFDGVDYYTYNSGNVQYMYRSEPFGWWIAETLGVTGPAAKYGKEGGGPTPPVGLWTIIFAAGPGPTISAG